MRTRSIILVLALFMLILQGCTVYPTHSRTAIGVHDQNIRLNLMFTDYDRRYIQQYYGHHKLHHRKVPPGYYQRYKRHNALPSHYRPIPISRELDRRLTPLPSGYIRVMIGDDMAIMDTRTRILYDIMWQIR